MSADISAGDSSATAVLLDVVVCATGSLRYGSDLRTRVADAGGALSTVECFDRCDACERYLLCRIDSATLRFSSADQLVAALLALGSSE